MAKVTPKRGAKKLSTRREGGGAHTTKEAAPNNDNTVIIKETCPSFRRGHLALLEDVERLRTLSSAHVESFDYFLDRGLKKAVQDVVPAELDLVDPKNTDATDTEDTVDTLRFWIENARVKAPTKPTPHGATKLTPRECRELGLMYSGDLVADFCYSLSQRRNGQTVSRGKTTKFQRHFGKMPIMVMSQKCHLHGKTPKQLVGLREEVSVNLISITNIITVIYSHSHYIIIIIQKHSTPNSAATL